MFIINCSEVDYIYMENISLFAVCDIKFHRIEKRYLRRPESSHFISQKVIQ